MNTFLCALITWNLLSGIDMQDADPCDPGQHTILDDFRRSADYTTSDADRRLCDNTLTTGWYRFQINGSEADMPTSCAKVNHCGTLAPIWLSLRDGILPTPGESIRASACVTWSGRLRRASCCGFKYPVIVKNCLDFFVYRLRSTGGCDLAYCAEVPSITCRPGQLYLRHLMTCRDYKVEFTRPKIRIRKEDKRFRIVCTFSIRDKIISMTRPALYVVWYKDNYGLSMVIKSTFTTETNDSLTFGEDVHPGEKVLCGVQSIHDKSERLSEALFLGIKFSKTTYIIEENRSSAFATITSSVPLHCTKKEPNPCGISVLLTLSPKDKFGPEVYLDKCLLHIKSRSNCANAICDEQSVRISFGSNLANGSSTEIGLRGDIIMEEDVAWKQSSFKTTVRVFDKPSGTCFVLGGIHVIGFNQRVDTLRRRGTFTFVRSSKNYLKIQIRVHNNCVDADILCVCGVVFSYRGGLVRVDKCRTGNITNYFTTRLSHDLQILYGREGKLLVISVREEIRLRLDIGDSGIQISILVSGFYIDSVEGLCGPWFDTLDNEVDSTTSNVLKTITLDSWRYDLPKSTNLATWALGTLGPPAVTLNKWIKDKDSLFERNQRYDFRTSKYQRCDCSKSSMIMTCPALIQKQLPMNFVNMRDVTEKLSNNGTRDLNYDFNSDDDERRFITKDVYSVEEAMKICINASFFSDILNKCTAYLKNKMLTFVNACMNVATKLRIDLLVPMMLRFLENMCETGILVNSTINATEKEVTKIFSCPENCYGNGICTDRGCDCFDGFTGVECLKKAERNTSSPKTTFRQLVAKSTEIALREETTASLMSYNTRYGSKPFSVSVDSESRTTVKVKTRTTSPTHLLSSTATFTSERTDSSVITTLKKTEGESVNDGAVDIIPSSTDRNVTNASERSVTKMPTISDDVTVTKEVTLSYPTTNYVTSLTSTLPSTYRTSDMSTTKNTPNPEIPTTLTSLTLVPVTFTKNSVQKPLMFISCDRRVSNCNFVYLSLSKTKTFAVRCLVTRMKFHDGRWMSATPERESVLRYVTSSLVECSLPDRNEMKESANITSDVFKVQVVSPLNMSLSSTLFARMDSSCQSCSRWQGCLITKDSCYIKSKCYKSSEISKKDRCLVCNPRQNIYKWTHRKESSNLSLKEEDGVFIANQGDAIRYRVHLLSTTEKKLNYYINGTRSARVRNGLVRIRTSFIPLKGNTTNQAYRLTVTERCGASYTIILKVIVRTCGCKNGGRCIKRIITKPNVTDYSCRCYKQYKGRRCEISRDPCLQRPCYRGVECTSRNGTYNCGLCPSGFAGNGRDCQPTCEANPCFPGVQCRDVYFPKRGFKCGPCPQYFVGNGIECKKIGQNACSKGVCSPLVTCSELNRYPGYRCGSCPIGYHGNGSICTESCVPACQNGGLCFQHKCICKQGFEGKLCEKEICSVKCLNGGTCLSGNTCTCQSGYKGIYCQTPVCSPHCTNNGVCVRPGVCYCPFGYYGTRCEKVFCYPSCLNGGVCRRNNYCKCSTGYHGNRCQHALCTMSCKNGGRCVSSNKCLCRAGWTGSHCQIPVCSLGCRSKGVCIKPNICACQRDFWGPNCQYVRCYPRCLYGGVCIYRNLCHCRRSYIGKKCQIRRIRKI